MARPGLPAAFHLAAAAFVGAVLVYASTPGGDSVRRAIPPALLAFIFLTAILARWRGGRGRRVVGAGAAAVGVLALFLGGGGGVPVWASLLVLYGAYLAATRVGSPAERPKGPRFRKRLFHGGGG